MKKKLLSLLLALVLVLSVLPTASAMQLYNANFDNYDLTYPAEGGEIYFDKDYGAIIYCDKTVTAVTIPEEIDGVKVTKILANSFLNCEALTSVTIPETVTYIGDHAFKGCTALTSLDLPDSLRILGEFDDAGNCPVYRDEAWYVDNWLVKVIPSLDSTGVIRIAEGTVGIASLALSHSPAENRVRDVYLPASLRYLSINALSCRGNVHFSEAENACLVQRGLCLFSADGKSLVRYLSPDNSYGQAPTFYAVPEGVETIEDGAFGGSALKAVYLPDSVITIGNQAFMSCQSLEYISFGKNVKTIGDFAFHVSHLKNVYFNDGLESIGIYAFNWNPDLQSVRIPASVKSIGEAAFYYCNNLNAVYFEGNAPEIGANAFCSGVAADPRGGYHILNDTYPIPGMKFFTREGSSGWTEMGDYTFRTWEANAHVHNFRIEYLEPNCYAEGWVDTVCACGERQRILKLPANGHEYTEWYGTCVVCGKKQGMNDVNDTDWFAPSVYFALKNGLMNGVSEFVFAPNEPMTRAMLVTVLWRYENCPEAKSSSFTDLTADWYKDAVAWAAENGIVNGVGDGGFAPNGNITREQMAAILYRYAQKKALDVTKRDDLKSFPDAGKVSSWATDAIAWAVAEKIIGGSDGKLLPQGNATRAQVATILMRFIEKFA